MNGVIVLENQTLEVRETLCGNSRSYLKGLLTTQSQHKQLNIGSRECKGRVRTVTSLLHINGEFCRGSRRTFDKNYFSGNIERVKGLEQSRKDIQAK